MNETTRSRELTALQEKRDLILAEFDFLQDSVHKSIEAGTLSQESYSGAFLSLQQQFDKFSLLVKNLEALEDIPELPLIQSQIADCYQEFLELKKEYEKALESERFQGEDDPDDVEIFEEDDEIPSEQASVVHPEFQNQKTSQKNTEHTLKKKKVVTPPRHKKRDSRHPQPDKNHPESQEDEKNQHTSEKKVSQHHPHDGAYQLKRITKDLGGGAYAVIENGAYQAAIRTDNDVIRAALNTQYYISTGIAAAGMVGGVLRPPASKLQNSAHKSLSSRQMAKYNADAIRQNRQLNQKIHMLEREISNVRGIYLSPAKRAQLEQQMKVLKSRLPDAKKSADFGCKIHSFQHERDLDNEVLCAFTKNGKQLRTANHLNELGSQYLRAQEKTFTKKYGDDFCLTSQKSLQKEIRKTMKAADSIKSQIDILEQQGKFLSAEQRHHLAHLKRQKKELGITIQSLKSQEAALKDYAYVSAQVNNVLNRANRHRQDTTLSLNFLRNTVTRPLYDSENNTTFLAYELKVLSDPRVVRDLYRVSRAALHAPYQIAKKVAPKATTRYRYEQDQKKKAQQRKEKSDPHKISAAPSSPMDSLPQAMSNGPASATGDNPHNLVPPKLLKKEEIKRGSLKKLTIKKKALKLIPSTSAVKKSASKSVEFISSILQKVRGKALLIVAGAVLLILLLFGLVSIIGQTGMSIIFSPHEGENGKIDLGPYITIIEQEKRKFTAMRDDLEQDFYEEIEEKETAFNQKYQNPPKFQIVGGEDYKDEYSKINISFDGPSSNDRELIAMMAVRFQQDLEDPKAMQYLQYLASKSRSLLTASDKTYHHQPGCVSVRVQADKEPTEPEEETTPTEGGSHVIPGVKASRNSGGSHVVIPTEPVEPTTPAEPEYEVHRICPGHRELSIHVHVLTPEELFSADDWEDGSESWEGWTKENREWVKIFLDMDWAEIYTGFRPGGIISVNSVISPEEERHIWERLEAMTGNAYAAAGIMGNLHCESRLLSSNLEDHYEGILGYSNETYTAAVDSGSYGNFITDAAGYGLAQWTYSTRKEGLLNLARSRGVSISDLDMQLDYLKKEFGSFDMMDRLEAMTSVEEASDYILLHFENPANANSLKPTRAGISSYFYNKYMLGSAAEGNLTQAQMDVIQIATNSDAYGIPARGGYCQAWAANVYGKAGFPIDNSSCARVSGERYGVSSDFTIVPPGAAVYGYSSSKYGHVGIYVGGGLVYHNVGGVAVDNLADWVQKFNGFCWGWQAGTDLTAQP